MSQKISAMPALTALAGTEFVPGITDALENVKIPVGLFAPSKLMVSLFGNNMTGLYPTTQWNDWAGQTEIVSPHAEWSEYDKAILFSTSGLYRIRVTTKLSTVDYYGNPQSMPLNMAVGTLMNGAITLPAEMERSRVALTGDVNMGYNEVTHGQWTDEYTVLAAASDMVYPHVHWHPMDTNGQQVEIRSTMTVELIEARTVTAPPPVEVA